MKSIKIAGKTFRLASRWARMGAFLIDGVLLATILPISLFLLNALVSSGPVFVLLSTALWIFGYRSGIRVRILIIAQVLLVFLHAEGLPGDLDAFPWISAALWMLGMFFMDGFKNGQGLGKKLLSLQVVRLKDGEPCTFKDSFIRRLFSIFQPLDVLWAFGKKRQRMGDKFVETVVVKLEDEMEETETKTEASEEVFENAIAEMKTRLSVAREKVNASIGVEKQFQDAYEGAATQVERWQERAIINLKAGREDLAREDIEKRNEYKQLAEKYKAQWEEQKQVVQSLSNLLEHLQQQMTEAEAKKSVVVAQHRNIDAEAHLREMLKEIEDNKAFETLTKMEQDATEAATLAKAAAEMDVAYQDTESEREFSSYAKEASVDKDLAQLKVELQK